MKIIKKVLLFFFKPSVFKIGLVITLLFSGMSLFHDKIHFLEFLKTIENKYLDFRFQDRGYIKPGDDVVLITVDEKSIKEIGRWPWSRDVMGALVNKLHSYGMKVIAFDAFFSEPEKNSITSALNKAEKKYIESVKRKNVSYLQYLREEAQKANTDEIFANAIENASESVILGYAFFLEEQEVAGIDQEILEENFANIEESQIMMVFSPEKNEKENEKTTYMKGRGILSNIKLLSEKTSNHAFVNARPDRDGPIRKSFLFLAYENDEEMFYFPSLALKSVMRFLNEEVILRLKFDREVLNKTKVEEISFPCLSRKDRSEFELAKYKSFFCSKNSDGNENEEGKIAIPIDEEGRFLINYRGPAKTFPHYSVAEVLNDSETITAGYFDGDRVVSKKEAFGNKIGIFGATAIGVFDLRNTPFSSVFPGLEIHANVIDNLLQGDFLTREDDILVYEFLVIIVSGIILSLAFIKLSALAAALLTLSTLVLYWYIDKTYFFSQGIWVHIVIPMFEVIAIYFSVNLFKYMTEERQKRQIKGAFQQYVAADVVSEMLKDPDKLQLGGEKKEITIMFSDIRSFTTISEGLEPQDLGKFLNMYLSPMTDIVIENKGTIDKYMGDAIMAMFGAPVSNDGHAVLGCRTALKMMSHLGELRKEWKEKGYPESIYSMDIGVGLNSGFATVGNMGSTQIFDYTCMGDNVNLGSRLEGINKEYRTHIMISEYTNDKVKNEGMNTRPVDLVAVKGKKLPVTIFELISEGNASQNIQDQIGFSTEGFELYKKQEWDKAISFYKKAIDAVGGDPTAELFVARCLEYKADPPGNDWSGVHVMKTK